MRWATKLETWLLGDWREPKCDAVSTSMMRLRAAYLGVEECRWEDLTVIEREAWLRVYTAVRRERWY